MGEKRFLKARNIIIIIISCILIGASVTGITIYLKDRGEAEAVAEGEPGVNLPETGNDGENATEPNQSETENEEVTKPENIEPEDTEGSGTASSGTTGSSSSNSNYGIGGGSEEEILAGITETTVLEERKVYEDLKLSWTTIAIPTITANMGIYKPELRIEKTATGIVKKEAPENTLEIDQTTETLAKPGDLVIYTIKVANIGNYKATNVSITETLDVIFNNKKVKAGEALVTLEKLEAGKQATLKVAYEITETQDIEKIQNVAYVTDGRIKIEDEDDTIKVNPEIEISGSKIWEDSNNQDGKRPESITINLLANGEKINSKTVGKAEEWSWSFTNLLKYAEDGTEINYTIAEEAVVGYTTQVNGYNVTNTHIPETTSVTVNKVWEDEDNKYQARLTTIQIQLQKTVGETTSPVSGEEYLVTLAAGEDEIWQTEELTHTWNNLPKYENGVEIVYTVKEITEVPEYQAIYSSDTFTITNIYKNATTSYSITKNWETEHVLTHPDITVNLYQNKQTENDTPYRTATLQAGDDGLWHETELNYTWEDLPKYKLDNEGNLILENGVPQLNEYSIDEIAMVQYNTTYDAETNTNKTTITNEAKGILEVTTYANARTDYSIPADVVLVLDVSGSMAEKNTAGNSKAKDMVTAVNDVIAKLKSHNSECRIGIVVYNLNSTTILPLGKYTAKSNGEYLTCSQGTYNSENKKYRNVSISTNVNELDSQTTVSVTGATFIQGGIAKGASLLTSANTQYQTNVDADKDGNLDIVTRVPIFILLSDGEPTKHTTEYSNVGASTGGNGSNATANDAYYTIRTAVEYKADIEAHYGECHFYTVGFGADTLLLRTVLNPDKATIDECSVSDKDSKTQNLYNKLSGTTAGAYGYDYADGSYTSGSMSATELSTLLSKFIHDSIPSTTYRTLTIDEITTKRVDLTNVDANSAFSITCGDTVYGTFAEALSAGVVEQDITTNVYYVNLNDIWTTAGSTPQVYIRYHELKTIPTT